LQKSILKRIEKMKRNRVLLSVAIGLLVSLVTSAWADESDDLAAAITSGKAGVNVRARYEHVDQDGIAETADALTARLRLNYRTGQWMGWSGFAEYDHVFHVLSDFNSGGGTSPDKGQYPVVADPKGSDLNQLYFDYQASEATKVRLGRQRILLDNQRFVGGVGWRQNEQTYDALTVSSKAIAKTNLQYSYITYVRRIFGQSVAAGKNNVDAHLLNAKIALNDIWSLTPYYYHIDNEDVSGFSTGTLGARVTGSFKAGESKVSVAAEFASQSDVANNPVSYDAQYFRLDGTLALAGNLSLGLSYESLGGDSEPGMMFRTPLATLHAFQGWADKFLTTPDGGIGVSRVYITTFRPKPGVVTTALSLTSLRGAAWARTMACCSKVRSSPAIQQPSRIPTNSGSCSRLITRA
jgi:putative salt-induced outer membrane protein YdiY